MVKVIDQGVDDWLIAAALLQFPGEDERGVATHLLSAEYWQQMLSVVANMGYRAVEIPSAWLRVGELRPERLEEFAEVLRELNLRVPALSVVRESVIHPRNAAANLAFSHQTIDAAAALDIDLVCLGLHDKLTKDQREVLWFWTVPGTPYPENLEVRRTAVSAYRELAEHAESVGVRLSLELYEDTYLGTAAEALRFLADINHPSVGLNPDIGNLIRRHGPVEDWRDIVRATLPYANYWHVKNYLRLEDPLTNTVLTHPAPLAGGIIDYREAVKFAVSVGFKGAFVVEHYGGDGLAVGRENERYLRSLLGDKNSVSLAIQTDGKL